MMSDSEEESFCFFGKPLEPYDEDAFPKKKPISVEDQIATDAQGRRRFHGAFTGGFSAGFFNTVGSLEGWTPSDFKSTRQDKARNVAQKPEDFMDDEDLGQFGIAPQTVRATSDYSTSKKRKRQVFSDGPIPGEPVLHSLLTSGNETIGYLLLKNIGLRDKSAAAEAEASSEGKVYGCEMPKTYEISKDDTVIQYKISDIYQEFLKIPKDNTFGLGYTGLNQGHINLFKSANLVIKEKNKKKMTFTGQAFGVGAFEDEDDDIYVKDDMTKYDFELTSEKSLKAEQVAKGAQIVYEEFLLCKNSLAPREVFLPPTIPTSFTGKHKVKKSRFEPIPSETESQERKDMTPDIRARYLGEEVRPPPTQNIEEPKTTVKEEEVAPDNDIRKKFDLFSVGSSNLVFDRFVSASQPEDVSNILEVAQPFETEHGTKEMRDAAKMKMFGPLTRISADWQPCSLLCKRFNVPEPHIDELNANKNRKRTKNLIFEFEKFADVNIMDFQPGLTVKEERENIENKNQHLSIPENNTPPESEDLAEISKNMGSVEEQTALQEKDKTDDTPKNIEDRIEVDKNLDLFKAVFLSSSESEDEEEVKVEEQIDRNVEIQANILSDNLLPKIKPIKEGILSNMDFSIFSKPVESHTKETVADTVESSSKNVSSNGDNALYGPSLPQKVSSANNALENRFLEDHAEEDEWVEKAEVGTKSKKEKKKHKHKKSSHKKKHKHSKEKYIE